MKILFNKKQSALINIFISCFVGLAVVVYIWQQNLLPINAGLLVAIGMYLLAPFIPMLITYADNRLGRKQFTFGDQFLRVVFYVLWVWFGVVLALSNGSSDSVLSVLFSVGMVVAALILKRSFVKKLKRIMMVFVIIILVLLTAFNILDINYARDDAMPLERALVSAGAVKECTMENTGRGFTDSQNPWYYAFYIVPGASQADASSLVFRALQSKGLFEVKYESTSWTGTLTYHVTGTSRSVHPDLVENAIKGVGIEVFKRGDGSGCGPSTDHLPNDKTLIRMTVGLPAHRSYSPI